MNKKAKSSTASYISVVVVMLIAVLVIFGLLEMAKNDRKVQPLSSGDTTTTAASKKEETTNFENTNVANDDNVEDTTIDKIINFAEPLSTIIANNTFFGDYHITTKYNGVIFNFNCTQYDSISGKCTNGSALMTIDKSLIPLYTYSQESENYINRPNDLYIILNDKYIVVTINRVGVSAGDTKIYNRSDGLLISTLNNVLTGYKYQGNLYAKLYPNITDNSFNYYMCDNNTVKIAYVDLNALDNIIIDEVIEGASCY